jgi:hypothetical protein
VTSTLVILFSEMLKISKVVFQNKENHTGNIESSRKIFYLSE